MRIRALSVFEGVIYHCWPVDRTDPGHPRLEVDALLREGDADAEAGPLLLTVHDYAAMVGDPAVARDCITGLRAQGRVVDFLGVDHISFPIWTRLPPADHLAGEHDVCDDGETESHDGETEADDGETESDDGETDADDGETESDRGDVHADRRRRLRVVSRDRAGASGAGAPGVEVPDEATDDRRDRHEDDEDRPRAPAADPGSSPVAPPLHER